jgi:ribonuclease Z
MVITLLGTGTPIPAIDRFSAAILIEAGEHHLLFDCGRGVTMRLTQAAVPASRITSLFLTHLHSDHVVGLPDLWLTGWVLGRNAPLRVRGPEGTPEMTHHLVKAYAADLKFRAGRGENLPPEGARMDGEAIVPGLVCTDGGVRVAAILVDHGHVEPAFGYRVEHGEQSIVISGDTKYCQRLIDASAGADLLVHSAWLADDRNPTSPGARSIASAEDAGRVFDKVQPKLAIVYHYLDDAGLEDGVRKHYAGPFLIGRDRMTIDLDKLRARSWRDAVQEF